MGKLFGTDGIRGRANHYPMTPEVALRVGRAISFGKAHKGESPPFIIIGKDTRISGDMLAMSLASGIAASGVDVYLADVLPTPGVAYLTRAMKAARGVVISASHNPYEDNGIKIFNGDGYKLSDEEEAAIETFVQEESSPDRIRKDLPDPGVIRYLPEEAASGYARFLRGICGERAPFGGLQVVIDCSHGATSQIAPILFRDAGAEIDPLSIMPDGRNINDGCGSEHPEALSRKVVEKKADLGIAFDGDGDRLIAVDETGCVLSGDQLIAIFADHLNKEGRLENNTVVTTVMSNVGLRVFLAERKIHHVITDVGDRHVVKALIDTGAILGGEDSGHMVFRDLHTTGDGLLSAIQLMKIVKNAKSPLSHLASAIRLYPQVLKNVRVSRKPAFESIPEISACIRRVEEKLGDKGRVLVRYSGTQSLCRVMVEGPTTEESDDCCERIVSVIKKSLA